MTVWVLRARGYLAGTRSHRFLLRYFVQVFYGIFLFSTILSVCANAQTSDLVAGKEFRVCSDPSNLPFSNRAGEGFENKLAELMAKRLDRKLTYTFWPQTIGFIRNTLRKNLCDVVMGYSQGNELVLNTNHYYVSAYVFVTLADGPLAGVKNLRDPALQGRVLGVVAGSPPTSHLARLGLISKSKPYDLHVDTRKFSIGEDMISDLEAGHTDGFFIWGPIGAHFASLSGKKMVVTPLLQELESPRMYFRITLGVRPGDLVWKRELNSVLRRNKAEIEELLRSFLVPLVNDYGSGMLPDAAASGS